MLTVYLGVLGDLVFGKEDSLNVAKVREEITNVSLLSVL